MLAASKSMLSGSSAVLLGKRNVRFKTDSTNHQYCQHNKRTRDLARADMALAAGETDGGVQEMTAPMQDESMV